MRKLMRRWLGIEDKDGLEIFDRFANAAERGRTLQAMIEARPTKEVVCIDLQAEHDTRQSEDKALLERIEDLEAAYPDYKKAKAEADERKANEVIPGFRPFTRRKRAWEAQHRKAPENKKP